jgi:hypothetical protein
MSITGHPNDSGDDDLIGRVSFEPAATVVPPPPWEATSGYAHLRKSNPIDEITPRTRVWLNRLPHHVRPINLIAQYPRIVNRVAEAWDDPARFGELSTDLLYDFRGNRYGFPPELVRELRALRECYFSHSPLKI